MIFFFYFSLYFDVDSEFKIKLLVLHTIWNERIFSFEELLNKMKTIREKKKPEKSYDKKQGRKLTADSG